ncbi:hypothetical protein H1R20_g3767, partial [Candolleomyces eurysporus]
MPLSIHFEVDNSGWRKDEGAVKEIIRVLAEGCNRWEKVYLRVPMQALEELSMLRGKVPLLNRLEFHGAWSSAPPGGKEYYRLDCFSDAPKLREAIVHTRYFLESRSAFQIELPWSQLEVFAEDSHSGSCYNALAEIQPREMQRLVYKVNQTPPLPEAPLVLPKLEAFRFQVGTPSAAALLDHVDLLTLPSLSDLEIRGSFNPADPVYEKVSNLIGRSGCDLRRLALDGHCGEYTNVFAGILSLCPKLERLDITNVSKDALCMLILDTKSSTPTLPNLQNLVIRSRKMGGVENVIDCEALTRVIKSRTTALSLPDTGKGHHGGAGCHHLDEIYFVYEDDARLHSHLSSLEDAPDNGIIFPEGANRRVICDLASKAKGLLNAIDDGHLRQLEEIVLSRGDSQTLTRTGIPYLLCSLSEQTTVREPREVQFRLRERAQELYQRWKPFLLDDVRYMKYRWSYLYHGIASLRWGHAFEDESDEEIWKRIIGHHRDQWTYNDQAGPGVELRYSPWLWAHR